MVKKMRLATCLFAAAIALNSLASPVNEAGKPAADDQIDAAEKAPLSPAAAAGHWNDPFVPFKIIGNVYYVGTSHIGAFLVVTNAGHFLLDGALPQSAPQVRANIRALGFDIHDVKYILCSHAHFDHVGGVAALHRASGAKIISGARDRDALESGRVDYGPSADAPFPAVRVDQVVNDDDTLTLGGATMTAHSTPGHTKGCTSWTVPVTGSDGAHHTVLFHCSPTVGGQSLVPEAFPGIINDFRTTFAKVRTLRADVLLGSHAEFFDLVGKRARQTAGDPNAFVDAVALQNLNTDMERQFNEELARQRKPLI